MNEGIPWADGIILYISAWVYQDFNGFQFGFCLWLFVLFALMFSVLHSHVAHHDRTLILTAKWYVQQGACTDT